MTYTYDAIVVGAGYIGCSVAYHLAAAGLRTALLDRGGVAAGASQANYGNVQVQDVELNHSVPMVTAGFSRFANLEAELGCSVGYRPLGSLLLIETENQWHTMQARLPALHAAGINAEMVSADHVSELEPLLDHRSVLGACYYSTEGQVNPFGLMWAYVQKGQEQGLVFHTHTEVAGFDLHGGKVRRLHTNRGDFSAGVVILCTGAWTTRLGQQLGRQWGIQHVHGQAVVTETTSLRLQNHIASAAFFEEMGEAASEAVLAISQTAHGNFLLGEVGQVTTDLGIAATPNGQTAIAALVGKHFPQLQRLRVLRGWAAPVAFTTDGLPYFGPVADVSGLILATAFKSTVIVTPLAGETIAQLVIDGRTTLDLTPFSPDREMPVAH